MEKQVFIIVLGLALCSAADEKPVSAPEVPKPTATKFVSYDIYKIESRPYPDGVLSVSAGVANLTDIPRVEVYGDGAGQKWRLESSSTLYNYTSPNKGISRNYVIVWGRRIPSSSDGLAELLYSAFQLRPTSYESFVLEQDETSSFLKWVASFTRLGQHKLWYLNDAGSGYTQIKNKEYDTCLTATGMNQPIISAPCTNSEDQQWNFVKL